MDENKLYYPNWTWRRRHVLGFVDVDEHWLGGIEYDTTT